MVNVDLKCANVTTTQTILHIARTTCDCDVNNNSTSIGLLPFYLPDM